MKLVIKIHLLCRSQLLPPSPSSSFKWVGSMYHIILPTEDNIILLILIFSLPHICNLAGGPLSTKLEKKIWLYQTVIQNSRYIFMDAKILYCRFKVIWLLHSLLFKHSFNITSMILSHFKISLFHEQLLSLPTVCRKGQ